MTYNHLFSDVIVLSITLWQQNW